MAAIAPDRYLLGDSAAEIEHLIAQADVYAPETEGLLDAIRVRPGDRVADIGCGALGILHLLSERVGETGTVVGVDREPRMIEIARLVTTERGIAAELVEADASATGLEHGSFDLVHARTLLLNVAEPDAVVAEMAALAKPGGVVALQEPDSSAWVCDPPHPAWDALRYAVRHAYRLSGKDFDIGRRAGRLLSDAGLENVNVRATARVTKRGDYYQTFLLTLGGLVGEAIVASGILAADDLARLIGELKDHLEAPGTLTCQPLIWQAWGRVR
jgi:ubiquinone/menaquinone biosynthesis C-methylase UbiE